MPAHENDRRSKDNPALSVVIPAFNEEEWLSTTVREIRRAGERLKEVEGARYELIVVDDLSTDRTRAIARRVADYVVTGNRSGIGQARNFGAKRAIGSTLVFIDADTLIDRDVLVEIHRACRSGVTAGAVVPVYESTRPTIRVLLRVWKWYAPRRRMTQGVCQFMTRELFNEIGGYDARLQMAEDTDLFHRALGILQTGASDGRVKIIDTVYVRPSMRRYEQWTSAAVWFWTNPLTTRLWRQSRKFWRRWYEDPPR